MIRRQAFDIGRPFDIYKNDVDYTYITPLVVKEIFEFLVDIANFALSLILVFNDISIFRNTSHGSVSVIFSIFYTISVGVVIENGFACQISVRVVDVFF